MPREGVGMIGMMIVLCIALAGMILMGVLACWYEQKWTEQKVKTNDLLDRLNGR